MALQEDFELQGNWLFRYRGTLPIIILGVGILVYIYTLDTRGTFLEDKEFFWKCYQILCLMVSLAGVFIRAYTVGHTPVNTSGRNTQNQIADSLNQTGIYSVVRHPLYLGNFLMWLGISLLTCNIAFVTVFILIYWLYYERIMYAEEQFLREKFGTVYTRWADRTPAFFPNFKLFVKPALSFSWKKVLKKEKNGVFALFLIFTIFDGIGVWLRGDTHYNYFLVTMTLLSGIAYCILKYLKKRTQVLNETGR